MSGYFLYQSSSLETFPDRFADLFFPDDPLSDSVYIVVQNSGLGDWLIRRLAQKRGSVMGERILMPEQALRRFAEGYGESEERLLFRDGLKLAVFKALEESPERYGPVAAYLKHGESGRLWQLADTLAGIFGHYGMNCPTLTRAWELGRPWSKVTPQNREAEEWQRRLWQRVFGGSSPYTHLSRVLSGIMADGRQPQGGRYRILLFGSMFLSETGLRFFRYMADHHEVHHFLLTPSKSFTGDSRPAGIFLRDNARLSSVFSQLRPVLKTRHVYTSWENPGPPGTALHRLRQSLIDDEPFSGPADDDSIALHNVTGPRRETEVLKDCILEALTADGTLAPSQICVLAPDISRYAPFIETLFPQEPAPLDFNLKDLPAGAEAPYLSAFRILTGLPGSRFSRETLLKLLTSRCFSAAQPQDDWRRLAEDLHIRWGTGPLHRREEGAADESAGSWEAAFKRILAAWYHDEQDDPSVLPARLNSEEDAESAGRLIHAVRTLESDLRQAAARSLKDWTLFWESMAEKWLKPATDDDEADRLRIKNAIRDLLALNGDVGGLSGFQNDRIPLAAFVSLLEEAMPPAQKKRHTSKGVVCASLKPTRAIPFRRIYLLGLDEGIWPGQDRLTAFDLRGADDTFDADDLSLESVNRFAFTETIFSAYDHLSLFCTGRDPEKGDRLSPSAPVVELISHLGTDFTERRHPLTGFTAPGRTWSAENTALAAAVRNHPKPPGGPRPLLPPEEITRIDLSDLMDFLKNPIKHFFLRRIKTARETVPADSRDDDVLDAEFLDWWSWRNRLTAEDPESLQNPGQIVAQFRERLRLESSVSQTLSADIQAARWTDEAARLADGLQSLKDEGLNTESPFCCRLTPEPSAHPEPGITELSAPLSGAEGTIQITANIEGLRYLNGTDRDVWTLTEFVSAGTITPRHNIPGWLCALLTGAADGGPREIRVFRLGGSVSVRRYCFDPDQKEPGVILLDDPAGRLGQLVSIYTEGRRTPLPLYPELADKMAKEKNLPDDPAQLAAEKWKSIVCDTFSAFSALRDCPYRQRYLPDPDFSGDFFRRAWEDLYLRGGLL